MKFLIVMFMLAFLCSADVVLSYHDGTPHWLTWGGTYRESWFHVEDFVPGATEYSIDWVDLWFYELSDQVYLELWNGVIAPTEFLASEAVSSCQYPNATRVYFDPPVTTGPDFCCVLNTSASSGTTSILADGTPDGHSQFSDDFIVWEEFDLGEYFITAGSFDSSLQGVSWGGIKVLF